MCRFMLSPVKLSRSMLASLWWAEVDSNHRPPAYQAGALTTALSAPFRTSPDPGTIRVGPRKPYRHGTLPRKEVIQPHLPIRLPCYDFTPITNPTVDGTLRPVGRLDHPASGVANSRGVTGGVYKARERIHRPVLMGDY